MESPASLYVPSESPYPGWWLLGNKGKARSVSDCASYLQVSHWP
jgi:hypothetical protein